MNNWPRHLLHQSYKQNNRGQLWLQLNWHLILTRFLFWRRQLVCNVAYEWYLLHSILSVVLRLAKPLLMLERMMAWTQKVSWAANRAFHFVDIYWRLSCLLTFFSLLSQHICMIFILPNKHCHSEWNTKHYLMGNLS